MMKRTSHSAAEGVNAGHERDDALKQAASQLRSELGEVSVSADVMVDDHDPSITVQVNSGLPAFAQGVVGRVAADHNLDANWEGDFATLTPK